MQNFVTLSADYGSSDYSIYDIRYTKEELKNRKYKLNYKMQEFFYSSNVEDCLDTKSPFNSIYHDAIGYFYNSGDPLRASNDTVSKILDEGVAVLVYAGDADYVCNWIGNDFWTKNLDWSGKQGFNQASEPNQFILSTGDRASEHVGDIRNYDKFTFIRLFNAGNFTD